MDETLETITATDEEQESKQVIESIFKKMYIDLARDAQNEHTNERIHEVRNRIAQLPS